MSEEEIQVLAFSVEEVLVPHGTVITKQGEPGTELYILHNGEARVLKVVRDPSRVGLGGGGSHRRSSRSESDPTALASAVEGARSSRPPRTRAAEAGSRLGHGTLNPHSFPAPSPPGGSPAELVGLAKIAEERHEMPRSRLGAKTFLEVCGRRRRLEPLPLPRRHLFMPPAAPGGGTCGRVTAPSRGEDWAAGVSSSQVGSVRVGDFWGEELLGPRSDIDQHRHPVSVVSNGTCSLYKISRAALHRRFPASFLERLQSRVVQWSSASPFRSLLSVSLGRASYGMSQDLAQAGVNLIRSHGPRPS